MIRGNEYLGGARLRAEDEKRRDEAEEEEDESEVVENIPSPYPDSQCSRTFPIHPKYSCRQTGRRERHHSSSGRKPATPTLSLRSPISILATPPPPLPPSSTASNSSSLLLIPVTTGPHSAPATYSSWGKQSPIPRPSHHHSSSFHSPLLLSSSASSSASSSYSLSPGRHDASFAASSPQLMTASSPLLLETKQPQQPQHNCNNSYLDGSSFSDSVNSPPPPSAAASAAAAAMLNLVRPDIPVGIAVARQRQTDQAAAAAAVSLLTVGKDPAVARGSPLPWTTPSYLFPSHPHAAAAAAPLFHPLTLPEYSPHHGGGVLLPPRGGESHPASALHGGYLGPGSAYWSPYSYAPLLLAAPHHYQHYHNQLLLLQQAALVSQQQQQQQTGAGNQVTLYAPPSLAPEASPAFLLGPFDPYRAATPGSSSSAFTTILSKKIQESKTKDDSGLETSENMSPEEVTELSRTGKKELVSLDEDNISVGTEPEPAPLLFPAHRQSEESVIEIPETAAHLKITGSAGDFNAVNTATTPPAGDFNAVKTAAAGDVNSVQPTEAVTAALDLSSGTITAEAAGLTPLADGDANAATTVAELGNPEEEGVMSSSKPMLNGLDLLTEGIARLEKYAQSHHQTPEKRVSGSRLTRHASMDSSMYPLKGLGLLCDVATQKMREEMQLLQPGPPRTIRSKSMELEPTHLQQVAAAALGRKQPDMNRNYHVATSREEIREFIRRRASRSSECSSGGGASSPHKGGAGCSPCRASPAKAAGGGGLLAAVSPAKDLDEMDAWEISMRLDMADIQRKYRQKYQELYRLESRKDKRQKLKKRRGSKSASGRKKSHHSDSVVTPRKPKKIYTAHRPPITSPPQHRFSIPSIKVEPPPPPPLPTSSKATKTAKHYHHHNDDSEEDKESESEKEEEEMVSRKGGLTTHNFQETFAKFRQSYLSSTGARPKVNGQPAPGSGSQLSFRGQRPNPFENLMKLSGKAVVKHEPCAVTVASHVAQPEKPKIKQEPEAELADFPVFSTPTKRKLHEPGSESPGKKKPKLEKYIVLHAQHQQQQQQQQRDEATHLQRQLATAVDGRTLKKKKKQRKEERESHRPHHSSKKSKKKDREDLSLIIKMEAKEEAEEAEEAEKAEEQEYDNEDMMKKKKKKKRKRKEDKKRVVRVTGLEEDRVMEIMDRTPTPCSSTKAEMRDRTITPAATIRIKQELVMDSDDDDQHHSVGDLSVSCVLSERNLRDGQRILFRIGSHFHPGRITEISPPDIYGILVDRERGNKPHIYSREEVLTQAILEVRPPSLGWLVPGMRVCAYWSTKYHYLHPGTIVPNTQGLNLPAGYVVIELDDGDSRDFHIDSIRILPPDYPIVVSEPDPMSMLCALKRRRTLSTESKQLSAVNIKREPLDQDEEQQQQLDSLSPSTSAATPKTKSYKPKKKDHRRRKDIAAAATATSAETMGTATACSSSSNKGGWCSEVTPDLKIRIRSPDSRPAVVAKTSALPPQENSAYVIPNSTPTLSSPSLLVGQDRLMPPQEWTHSGGGGSTEEKQRRRRQNTDRDEEDEEDSAFESNGKFDDEDDLEDDDEDEEPVTDVMASMRKRFPSEDKSKIRAFLPPQHLLWVWGDLGTKPRNKTRKIFHQEIVRGKGREERLTVGDSAVFLSTSRPDRPYIGRIESMWESWSGNMKVRVRWFYHAEETEGTGEGGRRIQDLSEPGALFESCHFDENDIQTISHKCDVLEFTEFRSRLQKDPNLKLGIYDNNDLYYLAGSYDPVVGTLSFQPSVFA